MFKMATPSRNREGSCPGRLNLVTSKDREVFLKAIHKDFIDKVDPLQSGFMDELYACGVLTETDTESLQGNNVNTRRDTARKLLIILTEIPFNVFSSRVVPLLCSMFPHIIPQNFWANDDDLIASDDQQNGTHCWRCAIIKRIRPKTLADLLYAANSLELPKYKKIISHGYNDEVMWAQIFQAFTGKPPDVSKHLSDEITSILQRYSFHCPENLHNIMSQGFPCECRKVDHVKPSSFEKVAGWLQMDTTNSSVWQKSENLPTNLTLPDMSSESESRNTSIVYPNSSEHSERDTETESTSLASNTTLHAELKASVERGFETFRVSPLLINLTVKYVLTDKHKLKVAERLNKDHISRNDCPNNGNLSDTLQDIFSETESRHTSTFVPDSKEDSDGKSEALSSYSDLSNCTAYYLRPYAESEASMESDFETFHVSTSKNDLSAKIVPEDENKLKILNMHELIQMNPVDISVGEPISTERGINETVTVAERLNKDHISRNDCPNNGNLSDTLQDIFSETESRHTSTFVPDSKEDSDGKSEALSSYSDLSNCTAYYLRPYAESEASMESDFETFHVSTSKNDLSAKIVPEDENKLKILNMHELIQMNPVDISVGEPISTERGINETVTVAERLNKDHISRNDCPNNGNLSDTLQDIFSETESRHTSTFVPDSKEDSDGKSEALSSYSDLSNCTAYYLRPYAESEASMESDFETFHVSTSKNDLSAKIVPEDENKLKILNMHELIQMNPVDISVGEPISTERGINETVTVAEWLKNTTFVPDSSDDK